MAMGLVWVYYYLFKFGSYKYVGNLNIKSSLFTIFHLDHGHLERFPVILKGLLCDLCDNPTYHSYQVLLLVRVRAKSLVM